MEGHLSNQGSAPFLGGDVPTGQKEFGLVPGLVWAFRFHDDGTADPLPIDQAIEPRHDGWLWLHFNLADRRAVQWLTDAELPAPALAMLLSRDRHQQVHSLDDCLYGIFADRVRDVGGASSEVGHLRFIMTERLLISGRHRALTSVDSARVMIEGGRCRLTHVAALLELISGHVADSIDAVADDLETELDQIEECLARRSDDFERRQLASVRRTGVRLHRQLSGLRAVFHRLERQDTEELKPPLRLAAGRLAQRLDALDRDVLELRERGHRLQEEMSLMMAEETNRHLYILSILTTLFLPPTLVTGVFGMNTKGLPFTDVETGFLWAMGLVIGSSLAVYLIMRRIGVFKL